MSMYLDRLARVVPPRSGNVRAVACNVATAVIELDNDLFQLAAPTNTAPVPGSYGRALLRLQAETNDLWVLFGPTNTVSANSAAVAGAGQCSHIPAGQDREFEVDPLVDKFLSATTVSAGSALATLRYWITSFPTQASPGSG